MVHCSVSMIGQMLGNYKYLLLSVVFYSLIRNALKIYLAHFSSMEHPYQPAIVSKTLVLLSTSLFLLPHIIAKIIVTAYQRVNLIFRCFVSRDNQILLRAYTTYVRPPVRVLHSCMVTFTEM